MGRDRGAGRRRRAGVRLATFLALLCLLIGCGTQPSALIQATVGTNLVTPTGTAPSTAPTMPPTRTTSPTAAPSTAPSTATPANQGHQSSMPSHSAAGPPSASAPPTNPPGATVVEVRIINFAFDPPLVTIPIGTTVVWVLAEGYHTVLSPDKRLDSPIMENVGDRYSYTFNEAGDYDYICGIHPDMLGKVVVTP